MISVGGARKEGFLPRRISEDGRPPEPLFQRGGFGFRRAETIVEGDEDGTEREGIFRCADAAAASCADRRTGDGLSGEEEQYLARAVRPCESFAREVSRTVAQGEDSPKESFRSAPSRS